MDRQATRRGFLKASAAGATTGEIGGMVRLAYGLPYDPYGLVEPPV